MKRYILSFLFLLVTSCVTPQQKLFKEMKDRDGYDCFEKSRWETFREYKCPPEQKKEEWFGVDVAGNPVIMVTCCSSWSCDANVSRLY